MGVVIPSVYPSIDAAAFELNTEPFTFLAHDLTEIVAVLGDGWESLLELNLMLKPFRS